MWTRDGYSTWQLGGFEKAASKIIDSLETKDGAHDAGL